MSYTTREELIKVFEDTQSWYSTCDELKESIRQSIAGTVLYGASEYPKINTTPNKAGKIIVTAQRSFEAAVQMMNDHGHVAVHNFASATNPGGGVTRGSRAQEECLCRCSTLYPVLNTEALRRGYYDYHRRQHNVLYTDACIYMPGIRVIKTDTDLPQRLPQHLWETVDVLTCAAPNLRPVPYNRMNPGQGDAVQISDAELLQLHKKRASHLLTIAAANDVNALVLGAFGCGAFENDPRIVAKAYAAVLEEYRHYFDEIRFAVYCSPRDRSNYEAFAEVLGKI